MSDASTAPAAFAAWALGGVLDGDAAPSLRLRASGDGYGDAMRGTIAGVARGGVRVVFPPLPAAGDALLLELPALAGDYAIDALTLDDAAVDDLAARVIAGDVPGEPVAIAGDHGRVAIGHATRPPVLELDLRGRLAVGTRIGLRIARLRATPAPAGDGGAAAVAAAFDAARAAHGATGARLAALEDRLRDEAATSTGRLEALAEAHRLQQDALDSARAEGDARAVDFAAALAAAVTAAEATGNAANDTIRQDVAALRADVDRGYAALAAINEALAWLRHDAERRLGARIARRLGWRA